jgi:hypothetical protein
MKLQPSQSKKILLTMTFYFHKNIVKHLVILFLVNTFVLMGLIGILTALNLSVFETSVLNILLLSIFLTLSEHVIKTTMSIRMYQFFAASFGMASSIIMVLIVTVFALIFHHFKILSVEGLIGMSFIFMWIRHLLRRFIVIRNGRRRLKRKSI